MSALAPTLQAFFTDRLIGQRQVSSHTVTAYRDTFRLLLAFNQARSGKAPSELNITDLDSETISAFLVHLRDHRHNSPRTRNARLAAIHSLFRYAALRHPEHAQSIQAVLAIQPARFNKTDIAFLNPEEVDALLAAPERSRWFGRRDHALLALAIQTGLRVSELTGLTCGDVHLGSGAHVSCVGKGRKHRSTRSPQPCVQPSPLGSTSAAANHLTRCSQQAQDGVSAPTPSRSSSPAMPIPLPRVVRRLRQKPSRHMSFATPQQCASCTLAWTRSRSLSGSAMNKPKQPRSTCTPTKPSKNALSH